MTSRVQIMMRILTIALAVVVSVAFPFAQSAKAQVSKYTIREVATCPNVPSNALLGVNSAGAAAIILPTNELLIQRIDSTAETCLQLQQDFGINYQPRTVAIASKLG